MVTVFAHGVMGRRIDPSWTLLRYFSFQPVLHDWCNKGSGMCYPVWDDAYKIYLLLIENSNPCDSGFPLLLSEWSMC